MGQRRSPRIKISLFCTCGAGAKGTVDSEKTAKKFREVWDTMHSGPAHIVCITKAALAAFKKESGSKP